MGNEPIQILVISLFATFIILILIHSQPKFTYFDWSNTKLDNVTKMTLYSVKIPDNYSKAIFIYHDLEKASKSMNMSDFELFNKIRASRFISENCTMFDQIKPDDPVFYAFSCNFFKNKIFYMQVPYTSFSNLYDFIKQNCTLNQDYICHYEKIRMKLDKNYA